MSATRPFIPRIALVFDFDETLAPDTFDTLFERLPMSRDEWQARYADPRQGEGWDQIIGRTQAFILAMRDMGQPLTGDWLREAGQAYDLYAGVAEMPDRLRDAAREVCEAAELHFVVLSSGYADLIKHTALGDLFDRILGSSLHFAEDGTAETIKRTIPHPQKARYIEALSKGLPMTGSNGPENSDTPVDPAERFVPMDQVIYVGDGASDLQAFTFTEREGGIALAVRQEGGLGGEVDDDERPQDMEPPDYREGGAMLEALMLAVRSHAARMELKRLGAG